MPLEDRDLKLLWDMLAAAREARMFVAGMTRETYLDDALRRRAVERVVEIVGEAARRVSSQAREQVPGVEWGKIVATRHILAHDYEEIDHEIIWRIATVHMPTLIQTVERIIDENPPGPLAAKDPGEP